MTANSAASMMADGIIQQAPSVGQLERLLEQRIQSCYREWTGQRPKKTTCHFFYQCLGVLVQRFSTPVEQLLHQQNHGEELVAVQHALRVILRQKFRVLIEEIIQVPVQAALLDLDFDANCAGFLFVLEEHPEVRNPRAVPKSNRQR